MFSFFHARGTPLFSRIPLNALRSFESAARLKSFKRAAVELSVTPSAISHQVKILEEWIGHKLFERVSNITTLTPVGASLFANVHSYFLDLARALDTHRPKSTIATIVITATPAFAALWLIPKLGSFYAAHPGIKIKVESNNQVIDLLRNVTVDLAIRCTTHDYRELYNVKLFNERFGVYFSANAEQPSPPPNLINIAWSSPESAIVHWHQWCEKAQCEDWLNSARLLDYEDEHYALQAAIAGQGYILASNVLAQDSLNRGLLKPFKPEITLEGSSYIAMCRPGRERQPDLKKFLAWITQEAAKDPADCRLE